MWSLGKIVKTPEVLRVYIGSFWDHPYQIDENAKLFEMEQKDLIDDMMALPRNSAVRKINELVKRARMVRSHAYLISHLEKKMPVLFGKESTQKELIQNLAREYKEVERIHRIPMSDFPEVAKMQEKLKLQDFSEFPKISERLMNDIEIVLQQDLPKLMMLIAPPKAESNPFAEDQWIINDTAYARYEETFNSLSPVNGNVAGAAARDLLMKSQISLDYLRKIWDLCDFEKDGKLDCEEFALALFLTERVKLGEPLPEELTLPMVPPSKRRQFKPK